jgi:hypothetical protein
VHSDSAKILPEFLFYCLYLLFCHFLSAFPRSYASGNPRWAGDFIELTIAALSVQVYAPRDRR